jgi:two-component system sensor histidine kinase YesM
MRTKNSLQKKLALGFGICIVAVMLIMLLLQIRTVYVLRKMTYEEMQSQAEFYQETLETEISNIVQLQLEFFNNRQLPFLASTDTGLSAYEEREAVLNVQERIYNIIQISDLVESGFLYIPESKYFITDSNITRMTKQDNEQMEAYLQNIESGLKYDGENYYSVQTGEKGNLQTDNPKYVFVLVFSNKKVCEKLEVLNASQQGGVLLYKKENGVILESCHTSHSGKEILDKLQTDEEDGYVQVQRINVGNETYLVFAGQDGPMGTFIQYVEEDSILSPVTKSWWYMAVAFLLMLVISVAFIIYTRKIVHKPLRTLVEAFKKVQDGNFKEHIYHTRNDEFAYLYQAFNDMEDRLDRLIEEVYVQKNLVQKAQLKQLQAQINPHFLYNSFFILSRRIKRGDYENAEEFAGHLGKYFKYLTRDGSDFRPLSQEVEHAKSYAAIQQARFANRIQVIFDDLPKEYESLSVPRLILQPLLENSFGHGLENKVADGILKVSFASINDTLEIKVEDNGEESDDEVLAKMQHDIEGSDSTEVTGLVNIHRRLQIYFQKKAGLVVERSNLGGICVKVVIDVHNTEVLYNESKFTDSGR